MGILEPQLEAVHAAPRFYRPELDALRFFAFLGVFLHHAHTTWRSPISFIGQLGVSVFFLLSAYLIVAILLREKESTGTVHLGRFIVRRILRIWPLYFAVIALALILGLFIPAFHLSGHAIRALLLLSGNLFILRNGWEAFGPIAPLWSISVEEQFYLLVPLLSRVCTKSGLVRVSAGIIALSYAVLFWLQLHGASWKSLWPNSIVQFQFFAIGTIIAVYTYGKTSRAAGASRAVLLLLVMATAWCGAWRFNQVPTLAFGFVAIGAVAAFCAAECFTSAPPPLAYLGKISYGLYVFHEIILWLLYDGNRTLAVMCERHTVIADAAALALTIAVASLSYRYFERPILELKRRFETVKTRPV